MIKKISLGLICAGMVLSNATMANTQALPVGTTVTYELKPNEPLELFNFLFWKVSGTCKIKSQDLSNDIRAKLLNRSGIINGHALAEGEVYLTTVYPNDVLHITAESLAKVELINLGEHKITAKCTA